MDHNRFRSDPFSIHTTSITIKLKSQIESERGVVTDLVALVEIWQVVLSRDHNQG